MNVFDFDETIYKGDSTRDFYFYCLKKKPSVLLAAPTQIYSFFMYFTGKIDKTAMKQGFYSFLLHIDNIDELIDSFWKSHVKNIKHWYTDMKMPDDVIISASPQFLLEPVCIGLKINCLMASVVDKKTGKYDGINCHGEEKVRRFREKFGSEKIDKFYSDSISDLPLAKLAKTSFMVKNSKLIKWIF